MAVPPAPPSRLGPDPIGAYVGWARFFFVLLAAVPVVGIVLLAVAGGFDAARLGRSWPILLVAVLGVVVSLAVLASLIRGLGARRPWAIHAVSSVCLLLIVFGLGRTLEAIVRGQILPPLETVGGLLVLSRPHGADLLPPIGEDERRRVGLVTVALAAAYVTPIVLSLVAV